MSFTPGQIVVPANASEAEYLSMPLGCRLRVESSDRYDTDVTRLDTNTNLGAWNTDRFVLADDQTAAAPVEFVTGRSYKVNTDLHRTGDSTVANGTIVKMLEAISSRVVAVETPTGQRTSIYSACLEPVKSFVVGATGVIKSNEGGCYHYFDIGTPVRVITEADEVDGNVQVERTDGKGGSQTQYVHPSDITLDGPGPEAPETLESFKIKFLEGAIARGAANGGDHPAQVQAALERLAGYEFLDPSTDLLSFQKRVVALAMDAKGRHNWCGEPEAYLTSIGLAHLLPIKKFVKVVTMVQVTADAGTDDFSLRTQATARVRTEALGANDYIETSEIV